MKTVTRVFSALVEAFNGMPLTDGGQLQSDTRPGDHLPSLHWKVGSWESSNWTSDEYQVRWTIPAELKVRAEQGVQLAMLSVLDDIHNWCDRVRGLPIAKSSLESETAVVVPAARVLADGTVIDIFEEHIAMQERGDLVPIADRFAGPVVQRVAVLPSDSDVIAANIQVFVEFTVPTKPVADLFPTVFVLGLQPMDLSRSDMPFDPELPPELSLPLVADAALTAQARDQRPILPVRLGFNGERLTVFGEYPEDATAIDGVDASETLVKVEAIPARATITSTQQMLGLGTMQDGSTANLTNVATWSSSDATIATVSATGLVTPQSNGSCTITATYNGIAGTAVIITSGDIYPIVVLADSPLLYWRLADSSGVTAADTSGNSRTGTYFDPANTVYGVTSLVTGGNAAISASHVNPDVHLATSLGMGGSSAWSLEYWIKPTGSFTSGMNVVQLGQTGPEQLSASMSGTGAMVATLGGANMGLGGFFSIGARCHVVWTFDGSNARLYKNGALAKGPLSATQLGAAYAFLLIGGDGIAGPFRGILDDVSLYGTALSAARVLAHYTAGI